MEVGKYERSCGNTVGKCVQCVERGGQVLLGNGCQLLSIYCVLDCATFFTYNLLRSLLQPSWKGKGNLRLREVK